MTQVTDDVKITDFYTLMNLIFVMDDFDPEKIDKHEIINSCIKYSKESPEEIGKLYKKTKLAFMTTGDEMLDLVTRP